MPGLSVKVLLEDIKKVNAEALIAVFYENVRPLKGFAGELDWLLCGGLSRLILDKKMSGSPGEAALVTTGGKVRARKIFLIGLGRREDLSPEGISKAVRSAVSTIIAAGVNQAALEFIQAADGTFETAVPAVMHGLSEGAKGRSIDITLLAHDASSFEKISLLVRRT